MRSRIRGEREEFREALGSIWDLDFGNISKGLVERLCIVGVKPRLAYNT